MNVTHRRAALRVLWPFIALALVLGCASPTVVVPAANAPAPVDSPAPTASPDPTLTPEPTRTPLPTRTPVNTPTRVPSMTPRPTRTAAPTVASILPGAALAVADFPAGFQELTRNELALLGMSQEQIERQLGASFVTAKPVNFRAFMNNELEQYQLVFTVLFYPLSSSEQTNLDLAFDNPELMLQAFALGFDGNRTTPPEIIAGSDALGEKSLGVTASMTEGSFPLRLELILARRAQVVEMLISLTRAENPPAAGALDLAATLDARVAEGLPR